MRRVRENLDTDDPQTGVVRWLCLRKFQTYQNHNDLGRQPQVGTETSCTVVADK